MRSAIRRWDAFWFEPSSPIGLAVCRVLFFGTLLPYVLRVDYREIVEFPAAAWNGIWPFDALGIALPSASTLNILQWLWRAALFSACIGFAWRWASLTAVALGFYLLGLSENIARINHSDAIVVVGLAVMALSHAADALSVDALIGRTGSHRAQKDGEYTWPIRAMWLVIVTIYFAAGVTKLATSGLGWVTSDNLANQLMLGPVIEAPLTTLGQTFGRHRLWSSMLAGVSLTIELVIPIVLVSRTARRILVPCLYAMQLSIRILLGPGFTEFFICGLFWVPWDALVARPQRRFSSPLVRMPADPPVHT